MLRGDFGAAVAGVGGAGQDHHAQIDFLTVGRVAERAERLWECLARLDPRVEECRARACEFSPPCFSTAETANSARDHIRSGQLVSAGRLPEAQPIPALDDPCGRCAAGQGIPPPKKVSPGDPAPAYPPLSARDYRTPRPSSVAHWFSRSTVLARPKKRSRRAEGFAPTRSNALIRDRQTEGCLNAGPTTLHPTCNGAKPSSALQSTTDKHVFRKPRG